jgi:hypothetical protein
MLGKHSNEAGGHRSFNDRVRTAVLALYAGPASVSRDTADGALSALAAKIDDFSAANTWALQAATFHHVMSKPENVGNGRGLIPSLGSICDQPDRSLIEMFPSATLDQLIATAHTAGYQVTVRAG